MALSELAKLINNANKERTPEQDFLYMFNEGLVRLNPPRQPSKSYKPSSLGYCLRMNYFGITGETVDENRKPDPDMLGLGESGTDRHERIQTVISKLKGLGYDCEWISVKEWLKRHPQPGVEVVKETGLETLVFDTILNMRFKCDGIIKFKGVYYILEIKTEMSQKWMGRVQPSDEHRTQGCCYSVSLGIDRIMFFYENRDNCKKKPFIVEVTQEEKEERVLKRIEAVEDYKKRGKVPPKTDQKRHCTYCDWTEACKKWGG